MLTEKPTLEQQIEYLQQTRHAILDPKKEVVLDEKMYPMMTEIIENLITLRQMNKFDGVDMQQLRKQLEDVSSVLKDFVGTVWFMREAQKAAREVGNGSNALKSVDWQMKVDEMISFFINDNLKAEWLTMQADLRKEATNG
jgi:hypothetical protein